MLKSRFSWTRMIESHGIERGSALNMAHTVAFPQRAGLSFGVTWLSANSTTGFIAEEWVLTDLAERLFLSRKR